MPAHVALQNFHHLVPQIFSADAPVFLQVADCDQIEFELAEALREGHLLVVGEMLIRKDQQRVLEPSLVELGELGVFDFSEPNARHLGSEGRRQRS